MVKRKLRKLGSLVFGGAALVKSTDVLKHARSPSALTGDIVGLTNVGVAAGFGSAVLGFAFGTKRKRR